jgi:hypothetical protein
MRIVLNHLTRMDTPRICVAGIDPGADRHVRPITGRRNQLTRSLLADEGGPFALGALVELGDVKPNPDPPETEDHLFWPDQAQVLGHLSPARYLELLRERAHDDLHTIFGEDLQRHDWNYAIDSGRGTVSLGVLHVRHKPDIEVEDRYGKLRLRLNDEEKPAFLSVTDVRFVEADHKTIKTDVVVDVQARMRRGVEVLLMLGLARAFRKTGDDRERHWLQVNGICMADRPLSEQP